MRLPAIKYFIVLTLIISGLILKPASSRADSSSQIGIVWNPPNELSVAQSELNLFKKSGVKYLILEKQVRPAILDILKTYSFKLYISIPNRFLSTSDLHDHSHDIIKKCRNYIQYYDHFTHVSAYGLFEYGQLNSSYFVHQFNSVIDSLRSSTRRPFYYLTLNTLKSPPETGFNFYISVVKNDFSGKFSNKTPARAILYAPGINDHFNLKNLESVFHQAGNANESIVFFKSDWLFHWYTQHIQIFKYISGLSSNPNTIFSTPPPQPTKPKAHWIVALLLLIWGTIAVRYGFEPNYRKSIQRYFNNHVFFVNDIIERHDRLTTSNFIVILVQSILGGMFLYSITKYLFSDTGFESLVHHYPFLGFLNGSILSLLFIGFIITLLYNLISIAWLYFGSAGITHISQAVTLHMWTQHLNVVIFSIILTLIMAGSSTILIYFLSILFVLVVLMSFYITVFDTIKFNEAPFYQHLYTTIPHFLLTVAVIVWLLVGTNLVNIWQLARYLT